MRIPRARCLALLAVPVLLAGCPEREPAARPVAAEGGAQGLTDSQRAEVARAVEQANRELVTAWETENSFDAFMARFAAPDHQARHGGVPFLVVTHTAYSSPAQVESTFRPILADRRTQVDVQDESVAVLSPDAAVHFARFTYTITRGGETQGPFAAAATGTWVRDAGEWKLLHYHQSWPADAPVPAEGA